MRMKLLLPVIRSSTSWLTKKTPQTSSYSSSSSSLCFFQLPAKTITSSTPYRFLNTSNEYNRTEEEQRQHCIQVIDKSFEESSDEWEEEDEKDPEIGDGGDGGGIVFGDTSWGQRALDIANEVLLHFSDDFKIFSFKNSTRGYIYMRLDKLSEKYGCPSMEEIERYSCLYKNKLEEVGKSGEIPDDLALEVSSPGAERLLRVPDDLERFKDMPMRVCYAESDSKPGSQPKDTVFFLDSVKTESEQCVWKLADVKENRDPLAKGRPMSRKHKDWRLTLPFGSIKMVTLYLEY